LLAQQIHKIQSFLRKKKLFIVIIGIAITSSHLLRGASYASSILIVTPEQILSWDKGFDKEVKQVWCATKAGYVFDKLK
jgi:hypothetical protein